MKRFRFDLDRILALRKHREEEWERKLAEATGKCVRLQRDIDRLASDRAGALRNCFRAGTAVPVIAAYHRYSARLDQEMNRKRAQLTLSEQEREKIQKEYLEASRDRKVLAKLRDRREAQYAKERKLEEVKEIDDINTGRAAIVRSRAYGRE